MRARTDLWEPRGGNAPGPPGPVRAEAIHWRHRERRNIRGIGKSQSVFGNYQSRRDGPIEAQGKAMRARRALPQPWVNDLMSSLATTWRS